MAEPGPGSVRFRVCRADDEVRHLTLFDELLPGDPGRAPQLLSLLVDETDSVARQRAQRAANERLEHAISLSGVSVWQVDLASQTIHFNPQGYRLLGLLPRHDGLPLDRVRQLIHPEDRAAILEGAEQALRSHGVVDVQARYTDGDGGWRHLLTRRVAERDADGRPVALLGILLDVSDQVRDRDRNSALMDRVRLATEAIGVGFWWRDLDRGVLEWDERMFRLHERDPGAGTPTLDEYLERHVHPADRPLMRARQALHLAAWPESSELTFRICLPDGRVRWVQSWTRRLWRDGRRMSFGMHIDVSDQREAQLRLDHERERDRYAIDAAGVGVWEWPQDGRPSYWNAAMYRLRGLDPSDTRPLDELVALGTSAHDLAQARARLAECLSRHSIYRFEHEVRWPDGSTHWLLSVGRVQSDVGGLASVVAGVSVDITERRQAEQLARERDRAQQASAAKSELMARVSHELRTPMNAVLGFAELMALDALSPAQADRLAGIRSAGRHLLGVIDDVLTLAKGQTGASPFELTSVDLAALVREALQWVAPMAQAAGIALIGPDPVSPAPQVRSERRRLGQVLSNLLTNAIKYNRPGGRVWVRIEAGPSTGGACWAVEVSDEGRGLSADQQARLYEPFNRLGAEREGIPGTGIGLSIAEQLVRDLGGTLQVRSVTGQGSQFRVLLPATDRPADTAPGAGLPAPAWPVTVPEGPAMPVLYVEDNPVNELVVRQMLALCPGLVLHSAADGRSGIALALQVRPRIVLLDLQLPDLSGQQVLERLRQEPALAQARFVALSANALPETIEDALARGFDAYWTKPLDMAHFVAEMQRLRQALA